MRIEITSTTDTAQNVQAAIGNAVAPPKTEPGKAAGTGKESPPSENQEHADSEKELAKSDTAAKEAEGDERDSANESEDDQETDSPEDKSASGKDRSRNKGGFQRRIEKLIAQRSEREREVEYWKREALAAKQVAGTEAPKESAAKTAATIPSEPSPEAFETHAEYVKALAAWTYKQARDADRETEQRQKLLKDQETLQKTYASRVQSLAEKTEDFQEALESVADIKVPAHLNAALMESELGAEVTYELAKNRAELERIVALSPLAATRELGKIEARIESRTAAKGSLGKTGTKKITQAPKPLDPVGSKGASVDKDIYDAAGMTQKEYEAVRARQRAEAAKAG
jgi:hypothetical protein